MKFFSAITVVHNRKDSIERSIKSVLNQSYKDFEYFIVDSNSTDGTSDIISSITKGDSRVKHIRENDSGIYDAINKGIRFSKGKYICLIHSDDYLPRNDIFLNANKNLSNEGIDILYGKASFFKKKNGKEIHKRIYSYDKLDIDSLSSGFMPCHTSMFIRREIFMNYGLYNTNFKIASDYEFLIRVIKEGLIKSKFIDEIMIHMQLGGISTDGLKSFFLLNKEVKEAGKINNINISYLTLATKYLTKIREFFS